MPKSEFAVAVDVVQAFVRPLLKKHGFLPRGRTFNRTTKDGLTQVINFQMGPSDPPGTTYIAGLRENLHGLFTVNLGVYVPEVARWHGEQAKSWVQEYHCCIRARLGTACGETRDPWWHARADPAVIQDVEHHLLGCGLSFLERFASRAQIRAELDERSRAPEAMNPPRIILALTHFERGELDQARELLAQQATEAETMHPHHATYVRRLAADLGLAPLSA
jgi:hypothetical protein